MKLTFSIIACCVIMLALTIAIIIGTVQGSYEYELSVGSYWNLADKASTISQKSTYIDKFVAALEAQGLQGEHDAVLYPNLNNSFDANMEALRSLQWRLREIQTLNPQSFEYQTAIQQITQQEQGEANAMLSVFEGCWWKRHHFWLWGWMFAINWLVALSLGIAATVLWIIKIDRY